jgi:CRP-like cAMP-binding protein
MKEVITTYIMNKQDEMEFPNFYIYMVGIFQDLKPETWKKIEQAIQRIEVERGDSILKEGELVTELIMAGTGCFKSTTSDASGVQELKGLFSGYDFLAPMNELSINGKSPITVEAIEPGFIYKISWQKLEELCRDDFFVRDFCRKLVLKGYSQPSINLKELAMISIKSRLEDIEKEKEALKKETQALYVLKNKYEEISVENPILIENVMQKLISSYMGVNVSTFLEYFNS